MASLWGETVEIREVLLVPILCSFILIDLVITTSGCPQYALSNFLSGFLLRHTFIAFDFFDLNFSLNFFLPVGEDNILFAI